MLDPGDRGDAGGAADGTGGVSSAEVQTVGHAQQGGTITAQTVSGERRVGYVVGVAASGVAGDRVG